MLGISVRYLRESPASLNVSVLSHKEQFLAHHKKYRALGLSKDAEYSARYRVENKEKIEAGKAKQKPFKRAAWAAYHDRKIQATPVWSDLKIVQRFYLHCPEGMTIDHIIPLKGKIVCGLHVINNLQYLTPLENCRKANKFVGYEQFT